MKILQNECKSLLYCTSSLDVDSCLKDNGRMELLDGRGCFGIDLVISSNIIDINIIIVQIFRFLFNNKFYVVMHRLH